MGRTEPRPAHRKRRSGPFAAGATALALVAGLWLVQHGTGDGTVERPPAPVSDVAPARARVPNDAGHRVDVAPMSASAATRIKIPSIGVNAPMSPLGTGPDHRLATPPVGNKNLVGWYRDGVAPGARGNAITVGHADTRSGPAVFFKLGLLRVGDRIEVQRRDRHTAVFSVDAVRSYPKDDFPDDVVYGPTDAAELRVITCGGRYDKHTGYAANVVVFAHLTGSR
ncbi:class F sortase (plasmid) [Embleya sp. NBC_00888]|uniref:class F sortase n=1 Tax=Embleya sp. NBC_00888 TaxID=2975960 RepID=UPI002F9088E1|nr:class F sortase [Embleya sp. NBC_00888]